ncbi:MAG: hypothetical protein II629_08110 [Ruminococcus sp.]|nr:hypothetical protein [Ruminococcus sp.]
MADLGLAVDQDRFSDRNIFDSLRKGDGRAGDAGIGDRLTQGDFAVVGVGCILIFPLDFFRKLLR